MSMSEELQKRAEQKPDKFTTAWWNSQFQECLRSNSGLKHALHLALADNEDLGKQLREALERIQALEADRELDRAKIGEHQERLDRQGEFLTALKQKKETK